MHRQIAVATILVMTAPLAVAGDFYIGAGIGVSSFDDTVNASTPPPTALGEFPDEASLNGRSFDSEETAWELAVGWNARDWISLELAYTDFGNTGQSLLVGFIDPAPTIVPAAPPLPTPPSFGGIAAFPTTSNAFAAALSVEEWSIAAKFRKPLIHDLSANWSIGVTRARFDAEGRLTVNEIVTFNPVVLNRVDLPYASPEDETGYRFGFGFEWRFNERFSADIGYRRHDTRVLDVETVNLQLRVAL